jgi:hypothetical protein
MAKTTSIKNKAKSLDAGKFAVKPGPSGKMFKGGKGVGDQKPGVSNVDVKNAGKKFPTGGGSGKMHGFEPVKPVKKA